MKRRKKARTGKAYFVEATIRDEGCVGCVDVTTDIPRNPSDFDWYQVTQTIIYIKLHFFVNKIQFGGTLLVGAIGQITESELFWRDTFMRGCIGQNENFGFTQIITP